MHEVLAADGVVGLAGPGQGNHFRRDVDADDASRATLPEGPAVPALATGQVEHALALQAAAEGQQAVLLDAVAERQLLRGAVVAGDRVVFHDRLPLPC